ncbi:MAG: 2,3-bisphosphoglycerate-independent phosphoglycerate mutase [Flavobacteriaceae bacterium]|jgi:2,3-bisphosphoglycerate-independent phosphoglycerate mutase|nr:2,3-bisphosphoglycerate-independent phosphoglycerate mutase [Flavobacteriaceae bacterium]MCI5089106.1 2,3-bisphosphoglycerate-independent phosphoglycerate mutase [Flavobacteriaceae bacterium]CAI8227157.1 MAG: 2,3-bisphosphoglycerate-independent phosphoglycerate mutase [SAR116 cluster bacterium]
MSKKTLLMILDGWGKSPDPKISAIEQAQTPYIDQLYKDYPNANLRTDGMHVGLPEGQMGNSEVGHMNLGAGRIVYQDLAKINLAVQNKELKDQKAIQEAFGYAKNNNKPIHFLGLLSDGGVHSHTSHLKGLITAAAEAGVSKSYVHAFTDGRDVDPKSGVSYLRDLLDFCKDTPTEVASLIGRYYAMDRDNRWERVKKAYDLLVHQKGTATDELVGAMEKSYAENITDEFLEPVINQSAGQNSAIKDGDVVLFFNFRTDRGRELSQALSQQDFQEYHMHKLDLYYVTMTNYDNSFEGVHVIFDKDHISDTLGAVIAQAGKKQIRIAETEKYPHVTFFFNGGRETPFEGESRILCPSPKVATYDLQPEMSAYEIRDAIVPELEKATADFVCLNFANPDMVGHTGDMQAAIKACEVVDACSKEVIEAAKSSGYAVLVIADHGNCDTMLNPDGTPNTAHTTNPVPFILVDQDVKKVKNGVLGDIAPTILELMHIAKPAAMTGESLLA